MSGQPDRAGGQEQVVVLRVWGVRRVAPAVLRMATGRARVARVPGVRFAKLLGTGAGRTFTPGDADPRHWALLTTHDDAAAADALAVCPAVRAWDEAAEERLLVRMSPLVARGRWSRREPFDARPRPGWSGPVAAITRARLRPSRALSFWRAVPPVVPGLHDSPGLRLALGVGEAPVALQGTFSLWRDDRALLDYAYRDAAHVAVVRATEPQRWYAEELFARFAVDHVEGTHRGLAP